MVGEPVNAANHPRSEPVLLSAYVSLPVFVCGIFFECMVCHGDLAGSKPHPNYLTHFYLSIAAGGALGGLMVGLVAPELFSGYWEMPLALVALALLGFYCRTGPR